jgi:hypothetical protein
MEINSYILDYLKNKKALITLYSSIGNEINNNNNNNLREKENQNQNKKYNFNDIDTDSDNDSDYHNDVNHEYYKDINTKSKYNREILGCCKFSLSEILTNSEFANKNYEIFSMANSKVNYGFINIDLKLENSASIEGRIKATSKNEKVKKIFIFLLYLI